MGTPLPSPKGGRSPPIFGPFLLWPNSWMHQDATWYGGRPWSSPHCARWGHSSLPQNREESPQIFGQYCGQTAGCIKMPLDTEVGRAPPTRHCVRCGRSYLQKKGTPTPTQFLAHVYCGQMAGWIKTPHGTEVDLGSGHIVLDGVPAPAKRAQHPPLFGPCQLWPRSPTSTTAELLLNVSLKY